MNTGISRVSLSIFFTFVFLVPTVWASKIKEKDSFPAFKLTGLRDNKKVDLAAIRKQNKVVLVDFWASWCEPCKLSFPVLNKLEKKFKGQGFAIVGINVDNDRESGMGFVKDNPVDFTLAFDEGKKVIDKVGVATMPSSFLLDSKGKVVYVHKGYREGDDKKWEEEIVKLLAQGKSKGKKK